MDTRSTTPSLPPLGLPGLNPAWSTLVTATDHAGIERTWHVLDSGGPTTRGTVLCVHGNPNWAYMWRGLAERLTEWRVVAVDALNMGFSERTGTTIRLAGHIANLGSVTRALGIDGPVITVAHDWGGPISMGWAQQHLDQVVGAVLLNTGVARPEAVKVPPLISIARATLPVTCQTTPTFLHGALRMARPQLARDVYRGYAAPYRSADQRTGIRDFVEDIPIEPDHPSFETLAAVASGLEHLHDVPTLLVWGAKDIIFSDAFLHDLKQRLPHAHVHRYPDAGHQVIEDTDAIDVISHWIEQSDAADQVADTPRTSTTDARIWSAVEARRSDPATAIIEMESKDPCRIARSISFEDLHQQIGSVAESLLTMGVSKGDRLATLVPPGIDLTVLVYACLRAGIVVVAPDAALGLGGLRRALRSSRPDFVVGDWRGLALARTLRLPASRLSLNSITEQANSTSGQTSLAEPMPNDTAAIVFTSGSTGPSKGVVYTHGQLESQRDAVRSAFDVGDNDKIVVAFAPFAVLAPALGIASVVPTMDVTAPSKLRAVTLAGAARAVEATIVFASPAVLANIAVTANELDSNGRRTLDAVRSVATAGAPVSPRLLESTQPVFPNARFFTPYGMTELMPVTIASADEITAAGAHTGDERSGVCVGQPLPTVDVAIGALDTPSGTRPDLTPVAQRSNVLGEVWVRAAHSSQRYDGLWARTRHAFADGWHRSGDVGHLDASGRLWIEGRVDHLIHTAEAVLAPVQIELQAESVPTVEQAVAVGVGPVGTQHVALVVTTDAVSSSVVADARLTAAVRSAVSVDVAAVLVAPTIPVDRRHNSKVDRIRVRHWADAVLRGDLPPRLSSVLRR